MRKTDFSIDDYIFVGSNGKKIEILVKPSGLKFLPVDRQDYGIGGSGFHEITIPVNDVNLVSLRLSGILSDSDLKFIQHQIIT